MKRYFSASSMVNLIESLRSSDRWLLRIVLTCVIVAVIWFILSLNAAVSVTDIRSGGSLTEGIIGTPRFVNPVLSLTRADQDVTTLLYSGLFSVDKAGVLVPDLAKDWEVSSDGTIYTIKLRDNSFFHDGIPLTATDVIFTFGLIQNDALKSPLRSNWNSVTASKIDDYTLEIILDEPYAPFIENLTIGILPAHIWREIPIEQVPFSSYNTTPIGSGPYKIVNTKFSNNGTVSEYTLEAHTSHSPVPFLPELFLRFYADERALEAAWDEDITSSAYLRPEMIATAIDLESYSVTETPLTRMFAVFFNQTRSVVLRDIAVREALELTLDREQLVTVGLAGAGIPRTKAVISANNALESAEFHAELGTSTKTDKLEIARTVLAEAGWNQTDQGWWEKEIDEEPTKLEFTIKTVSNPVFDSTLTALVAAWSELGVIVTTEQFTQSDLVQSVIRERDFEMLLFGIDPGRTQDIYPFWHSSQLNDPGLNIAEYTNLTVDQSLETARTTSDPEERRVALDTINTIITEERPAIFLFQPTVQYVAPVALESSFSNRLSHPADRFNTITNWYVEQQRLWPFFTKQTDGDEENLHTDEQNKN